MPKCKFIMKKCSWKCWLCFSHIFTNFGDQFNLQHQLYTYWINRCKLDKINLKNSSRQYIHTFVLEQKSVCYDCSENSYSVGSVRNIPAGNYMFFFSFWVVFIFHTLFYCFYCQLWAGKCRLGSLRTKSFLIRFATFPFQPFTF